MDRDNVKNIFNDTFRANKIIEPHKDDPLINILTSHMSTEKNFIPIMTDCYEFYKKYSDQDKTQNTVWDEMIAESSTIWKKYKQCNLVLNLMDYFMRAFEKEVKEAEKASADNPDDDDDLSEEDIAFMDECFLFRKEAAKDLEKGQSKKFICPLCGGNAEAGRSDYNGHLHAKCYNCGVATMQ